MVYLDDYPFTVSREGLLLRKIVIPDLMAMNEAAQNDGVVLQLSSAFRSYEYQKDVYERNVKQLGKDQADRESAQPGKSQHQLGTTVDFGSITDAFALSPAGIWLADNAWRFGFSLSYPEGLEWLTGYKYESWHFRYLTRAGAALEKEFFSSIQHYLLTFLADNRTRLLASRIVQ
jgi:D-alanyl-D-alanine carboxypeptidase